MKNKKLYVIFSIALIIDLLIFGYLIYSNIQLNKKVDDLQYRIESKFPIYDTNIKNINDDIGKIQQDKYNEENTKKLNEQIKSEHPTWVDDEYYFDNSSTEGLTPISQEKAIEVWNEYRKNVILNNLDIHKVKSVTTGKVKPTNYFTSGAASKIKTADYERDAYIIYCSDDDDLTNITGYVDMYTGKVIGGFYGGV